MRTANWVPADVDTALPSASVLFLLGQGVRQFLDLAEPVGVRHFVPPDQDPNGAYRDAVVGGSHLALSRFTSDLQPAEMAGIVEVMKKSANPVFPRSRAEIGGLFAGFGRKR